MSSATLQARKQQLEDDLRNIEKQIFDLEEAYIEETSHYGNVIRGWDGYVNSKPKQLVAAANRKLKITEKDRLFSFSSTTAPQKAADADDDAKAKPMDDDE